MVASWWLKLVGMETGKWTEYGIGMESLRFCRILVYRPAACCLPPGDDGCRSGSVCLKEGEKMQGSRTWMSHGFYIIIDKTVRDK